MTTSSYSRGSMLLSSGKNSRIISGGLIALIAVVALALAGCIKVNSQPFQTFSESLRTLSTGVEAQAEIDYREARQEFETNVLSAPSTQVLELQLTFPQGNPFGFKYNRAQPPLYVQLDEFRRALKNLNTAMGDYAGLLAQLAGNDTVNKAHFDQLATDLNKNVTSAAATLNLGLSGTAPAFFSTAAAKIFQEIIERKRKKKLRQAILAQQDRMKLYSEAAQNALVIIVQGVRPRYDDQFSASSEKYFAASNDAAKTAALQEILTQNSNTVDTIRTLERLKNSYAKLPRAHADLAASLDDRPTGLPGILDFYNETVALHDLFTSLKDEQ